MSADLDKLERGVMEMLVAGDDASLQILANQFAQATLASRELTGVGFYANFAVPSSVPRLEGNGSAHFGDVTAQIDGLQHGAGFVLHIRDGLISCLEGYSFDEPWPADTNSFKLSYVCGMPRDLTKLRPRKP
jgi:hypothetical protein